MTNTYAQIPTDSIVPSPYQMRTVFGGADDDEMAESVEKHGILQPLRVRRNGSPTTYELIFGERRLRAAKAVNLAEVPAIIVEATDDQVVEQLLVENLRRRDLEPLEEARGFRRLTDDLGYTAESIAEKTGKSKSYVYARLRLTDLVPVALTALAEGTLSASVAELLARIPSPKLQEQATADVLGLSDWRDYETSNVQPESISTDGRRDSDASTQPLSFRAARALILKKYATRLSLAVFSTADADLVPGAGACTTCPHRSGNQPELAIAGAEKSADDLCTNPPCFAEKTEAVWQRAVIEAKDRGIDVVDGTQAEQLWAFNGELQYGAPYVALETKLPYDLDPTGSNGKTFGKLLGKDAANIPRALVKGPDGTPRELLVKANAIQVLRESGKIDKPTKPEGKTKATASTKEEKEAAAKAKARADEKERVTEAAMTATLGIIAKGAAEVESHSKAELAMWKWVARVLIDRLDPDDEGLMLARRGLDNREDLAALPLKSIGDIRALVVEFLVCSVSIAKTSTMATKETKELFDEVSRLFKVDFAEQVDVARDAAKAAKKAEVDATDAKAKRGARK